jgi:twitching motility protein PilT
MAFQMDDLLQVAVDEGASDLHLRVGVPPILRQHGKLVHMDLPVLAPEDTERLMKAITSEAHIQRVREGGGTDFGFAYADLSRFRVSVFKERGNYGIVLRQIPNRLMSLDEIGLPPGVKDLLMRPRGLILVTGPTGSGKTTTLASMLDVINREEDCHIITIEDPIEYYHPHKKSILTQREIGVDVPDFAEALRRGLRQDPDVILVGEMRDLATMEAAITAAETGHLVFATLHTTGAARTVDRIVDAFPTNQQEQIRTQLASSILAVISQVLMKRADGKGRVACFEIMIATDAIRALIREAKTFRITSDIQTGAKYGMQTLDANLLSLYERGLISYGDLITTAQDPQSVVAKLQGGETRRR